MESLVETIIQVVVTSAIAAIGGYGAVALNAFKNAMQNKVKSENIAIIDRAIASGVAYAKSKGLDEAASNWLSTVLFYTKNSIPDTLAENKVKDNELADKVKAVAAAAKVIKGIVR